MARSTNVWERLERHRAALEAECEYAYRIGTLKRAEEFYAVAIGLGMDKGLDNSVLVPQGVIEARRTHHDTYVRMLDRLPSKDCGMAEASVILQEERGVLLYGQYFLEVFENKVGDTPSDGLKHAWQYQLEKSAEIIDGADMFLDPLYFRNCNGIKDIIYINLHKARKSGLAVFEKCKTRCMLQ